MSERWRRRTLLLGPLSIWALATLCIFDGSSVGTSLAPGSPWLSHRPETCEQFPTGVCGDLRTSSPGLIWLGADGVPEETPDGNGVCLPPPSLRPICSGTGGASKGKVLLSYCVGGWKGMPWIEPRL